MKINRLLSAALITLATVLTGCVKESVWDVKTGIDESKAAPEDFNYDENMSSNNSLTVYWNGQKAKAAGAKSFLVQLTDPDNMDKGDTWNTKVTKVLEITEDTEYSAQFSGLTEYDCYYVRIRANYPGSVYSPWVYLTREDGEPALYQVGHGEMALVPVVALEALVTDINVSWTKCVGAVNYYVEWKKTSETAWNKSADLTDISYTISGLTDNTEYEVKVTSVTADNSYTSEVVKAKTNEKPPFPMEIATAAEWVAFVNGDFVGLANNGADDVVTLTADLDFTGVEYATEAEFKGVVNGNGKTIKNLAATTPLFKSVTEVKDLTIDASSTFTSTSVSEFAAVAHTTTGVLSNVINNAEVKVTMTDIETFVIGGLVAYAYGNIEGCANNGAVTLEASTVKNGTFGGVVAYTEALVKNTDNAGAVTVDVDSYALATAGIIGAKDGTVAKLVTTTIGGIVGLAHGEGFSMEDCENQGVITWNVADCTVPDTYERQLVGGIVGAPDGLVKNCKNLADINVSYVTPDRSAHTAKGNIICIGGIGGGDFYASAQGDRAAQSATDYINCVNEGNITVDNDAQKSNSTVAGIVGWPGVESKEQVCVTDGCTNRGNILVKGSGKARIGGLQGGSGHLLNSYNYGNVVLEGGTNCVLGSAIGFHSQNHRIENVYCSGNVTATVAVDGIAGLVANNGNAENHTGAGCVVDCVITGGSAERAGMVVGYWNGTSKAVTLGTTENPIQVSGSVNGEPASTSNLCGTANSTSVHVINADIK